MTQDTDLEKFQSDEDYLTYVPYVPPRKRRIRQIAVAMSFTVALIAGCFLVSGGAKGASSGDIIISEVVSSNCTSLAAPDGSSPDWIELYNCSESDANLSGFSIGTSLDGPRHTLGNIIIPSGGYTVLYADSGSGEASIGFSLSRDGETLYLFDPDGNVLECINVPALFTDISYARHDNGSSFGYCLQPTPAAANDTQVETLDVYESIARAANLIITEVMPDPSTGSAWVELYNAGKTEAALNMFYIADDELDATPYRLPDYTLGAGQYAIIYAGGAEDVLSVPLNFGTGDHGAYLFDVTGALRSQLPWAVIPGSDTAVVASDTYTKTPTPGAPNSADTFTLNDRTPMDDTDPVRISEVLISGKYRDSEHNAWAEICNTSDQAVSLLGYYLSDDAGDPLRWAFPDIILEPGGYTIVFLSGNTEIPEELHALFLVAADEALYLTELKSMRTDTFVLPAMQADNVSVGRTKSGDTCYYAYPSPATANAMGFSTLPDAVQSRVHGVYISEVCATGGETDWIELYNGSEAAIDLSGWYLSDDADDPLQWRIPSLVIEPGAYAVIDTNGKTQNAAPFGISISGETLVLSNANGSQVDTIQIGVLRPGLTCGRVKGDEAMTRVFFTEPTPGILNSELVSTGYAAAPLLSETGLYHTEAFQLSLSVPTPDTTIYYTLDGSEPNDADNRYTGPITIGQNTVVRAVAYAPGLTSSDIATATYLFEDPHTIPVFCLSGEPSEMITIFNKADRNYKPEYAGFVEYYETNGTLGVCFPAGLKPKGRGSLDYDQKSVTIRLKGKYGRSEITYPFFEDGNMSTFSELTLRTGAQDMFAANLRDTFFQKLGQNLRLDSVRTRYVAVYVNGHYWGLYSMDEEQEEGYFKAYFGIGYDNMDMIDRNNSVLEGSCDDFLAVRQYGRQWDLSDEKTFEEFAQLVDTDACMDYLILNTYFANGDVVNQRFWHARDGSVKWRPLLFDLDWCMRFDSLSRNTFSRYFNPSGSAAGNGTITYMDIFCGLKRNPAWREAFIDRFIELAYTEFDTDRVLALYDETVALMEPEMVRQIARWHTHRGIASWRAQTDSLRNVLEKRRDVVLKQMAHAFGLSDAELQARIEAFASTH